MDPVRIGFVGVGQIAKQHLERYTQVPGARVVAATDIDEPELARVAGRFGIERTFTDYREMLKCADIDAVDVCLHNNMHAPVTIAALEAGKHVYCEKPMAGAYVDARAMLETARKCDRRLSIQLALLFTPESRATRRLIEAGMLGRLYHARSVGFRRRGRPYVDGYGTQFFVQKEVAAGGALYDMGVYHISQVLDLLGLPTVERISGSIYQETAMDPARCESSGYSVEELGMGFVKCAGGVTIDVIESWAMHLGKLEGSSILGARGGVRLDPFSFHSTVADLEMDSTFDLTSAEWRRHQLFEVESCYDSAQHHWIAALQGRVPLMPTAETALATMLISEGIYQSHRLGREVTADEVAELSVSTALRM